MDTHAFNEWLQARIQNAPWWGISLVLHILLFLIFASVIMSGEMPQPKEPMVIIPPEKRDLPDLPIEPPPSVKRQALPPDPPPDDPLQKTDPYEPNPTPTSIDDKNLPLAEVIGREKLKGLGTEDVIGVGNGLGDYGRGRPGGSGGPGLPPIEPQPEVVSGLLWLARHQNPDGSWGATSFQNQCRGTVCSGTGSPAYDIGLTGLALLAFTGAGYTNLTKGTGNTYGGICFGNVVLKAAEYLINQQDRHGCFGRPAMQTKFMYSQAVATYALVDLYGMIMNSPSALVFKDPAQRAIDYLIRIQNPYKAWRYQPQDGQNDTSVTGWCVMALKAAENAGLKVPQSSFADIKSFYDEVTDDLDGAVGYTAQGTVAIRADEKDPVIHPSLTAVGVMVRIFIDENTKDERIKRGVDLIIKDLPQWNPEKYGIIDYYYWFYASYCLYQYDGPRGPIWKKWREKMLNVLIKNQRTEKACSEHGRTNGCANGSWDPIDRWGDEAGRVYATAINILTLEVFYRLGIVTRMK